MKIYTYTVSGRGLFPADMLRHDQAWPRTQGDVDNVFERERVPHERYTVSLCSVQTPTIARWGSFTWSVGKVTGAHV